MVFGEVLFKDWVRQVVGANDDGLRCILKDGVEEDYRFVEYSQSAAMGVYCFHTIYLSLVDSILLPCSRNCRSGHGGQQRNEPTGPIEYAADLLESIRNSP